MRKLVKTFRIDPEGEALVEAAARRSELPPSTFVRRAAVSRAAELLASESPTEEAEQIRRAGENDEPS